MDNFNDQLRDNLHKYIKEFNSDPEYKAIRELYKKNFEIIKGLILRAGASGHKLAIEDISMLDHNLEQKIMDNMLLLKEINKAISTQAFTLRDIN